MSGSYYQLETLKGEPWKDQHEKPVKLYITEMFLRDDCMHLDQVYVDEMGKEYIYRGIPMSVHFNPGAAVVVRRVA